MITILKVLPLDYSLGLAVHTVYTCLEYFSYIGKKVPVEEAHADLTSGFGGNPCAGSPGICN